jgi:TonB-dependent SusC/RagA subfamily outer membrane receptor
MRKAVLLLLLFLFSFRDEDPGERNIIKIRDAFKTYVELTHPQVIYLHLDKEIYYAKERIWFRAFLLDQTNLHPDTFSDHMYVELIDPYLRRVQTIRIRAKSDESSGSFYLGDTIPEGIYQIRAYTNWMKNFGSEYFFSQNIEIRNPMKKYLITPKTARTNKQLVRKLKKKTQTFRIGFYPEGGNLLENVECLVAFKAEDLYGKGIEISGKILDKKKGEIVSFQTLHNGMGSFLLKPEEGNVYTAYIQFPDGTKKQIALPSAMKNTVGLKLIRTNSRIEIVLRSNKPFSNDRPANEFVLIGQVRNKIYYASYLNLLNGDSIFRISPDIFPSGIVDFTLFNNRLNPIAERLHFVNHGDFQNFEVHSYRNQDSIHLNVQSPQKIQDDEYFTGSVAVVFAGHKNDIKDNENIISRLLLTNDLPGTVEQPAYYLKCNDRETEDNTDLLMLTHGWKRFLWQDVLKESNPVFKFENEEGITVEGTITREVFEFPVKNAEVHLYILNEYNDEFQTCTDEKGFFRFNHMYYNDTIDVRMTARKSGGRKNVLIHLEEYPVDLITNRYGDFFLTTVSKMNMKAYRRMQSEIAKEELKRRDKELDSIFRGNIYGRPDFVLWGDDIPSGYTNLLDAMQGRIPGVNIVGNSVTIRGINTIMGSNEPLLLIDGIPTEMETINSIPVQDVERIEILKGPSAAMYGSRGANGVIAIYTKHGVFMKKGEITFSMLGYHVIEQFCSPSSQAIESRIEKDRLPLTVYWDPDITITDKSQPDISFPMFESKEELYVIIEVISNQGRIGYSFASVK